MRSGASASVRAGLDKLLKGSLATALATLITRCRDRAVPRYAKLSWGAQCNYKPTFG